MKNKPFYIAILIVSLFLGIFIYFKQSKSPNQAGADLQTSNYRVVPLEASLLVKPHSITKGPAQAKVTLVEFLDPECESCAATYPFVKDLMKEFENDVKIVVRYMTYHQNSKYVANILEGARSENKYWETLSLLFSTQNEWANHHMPKPELIPEILKPLKLNMSKIISDAKAGQYDQQITEDFEDGKKAGVRGTPTFFVNGQMVDDISYESLRNAIRSQLNN